MNARFLSHFGKPILTLIGTIMAIVLWFASLTTVAATTQPPARINPEGGNTPPALSNVAVTSPRYEASTVTLTGEIFDPDVDDTFTLDIDWGEGAVMTYTYPAGTTVFTETHIYVDDDPSGTPQDDYSINLTLQDSAGGMNTDSTTVTVKNWPPMYLVSYTTFHTDENEPFSVLVRPSDSSPNDTFTLAFDWGDGTVITNTYPAGTTFYTLTHIYLDDDPPGTSSDPYYQSLVLTDDDTGTSSVTIPIPTIVHNVAPTLSNLSATTMDENGLSTLTGNITDPGTLDSFTLAVDWGDTTVMTYTYPAETTAFTETHTYSTEAGEPLTPLTSTVFLTLTDDDNGQDTGTVYVNTNLTITSLAATSPVAENNQTTLLGTFTDPDPQDTFTALIDWGDGSVLTSTYPAGATDFMHTHQYLDDNPTGTPSDFYTITVTLMDDNGGSDTATTSLIVQNVTPTITTLAATSPVTENDSTTLIGTFTDPGTQDTFTVMVDWGDGNVLTTTYPAGAFDFMHTHQYLDDGPTGTASDPYTVTVTLMDDDGGSDTVTTTLTVNNIAPAVDAGSDQTVEDGTELSFIGVFTDPGTLDTHTILWDFGDGNIVSGVMTTTHTYDGPGVYTVTLTITDDDGGVTQDTLQVTVNDVGIPEFHVFLPVIHNP